MVYGDDLDMTRASFDPIGISCRICERRNCPQRAVPPIASAIEVRPDRRSIVPYDIV
ncbi:MAG: short-chain fatty acyl-CoA regulator family protein [Devosia sp.]